MGLRFEWDERKATRNAAKHGISFVEAATAFGDPLSITIEDPGEFDAEQRFVLLGTTHRGKLFVVVHTERGDSIRIISARRATRREREQYEQA